MKIVPKVTEEVIVYSLAGMLVGWLSVAITAPVVVDYVNRGFAPEDIIYFMFLAGLFFRPFFQRKSASDLVIFRLLVFFVPPVLMFSHMSGHREIAEPQPVVSLQESAACLFGAWFGGFATQAMLGNWAARAAVYVATGTMLAFVWMWQHIRFRSMRARRLTVTLTTSD